MIWSTYPSKNGFKRPKSHDKAVQSNMQWLKFNKINAISILQSADKQGNPSFLFHAPGSKRRYPCTQTASAVPKEKNSTTRPSSLILWLNFNKIDKYLTISR